MKKIKIEKKMFLKKETIVSLTNQQLNAVKGGSGPHTRTCPATGTTGAGQSQTSSVC